MKIKKALKVIGYVVGGIVALALLLVLTLPLWLGPVVKPTVNALVPKYTLTDFHLGVLSLNPYTGCFELGDMQLANPTNYSEKQAVTLGRIFVNVGMTTLCSDVLHVEEVSVEDLFISVVKADGVGNFDQIQYNVAGGKEKYEAAKAESKRAEAEREAKVQAELEAEEAAEKEKLAKMSPEELKAYREKERQRLEAEELKAANAQRVVIDKLSIKNIRLKYGLVTIPIPSITLTDLGKESDGISFEKMWDEIVNAVLKSAAAIGDGAKVLGGLAVDGAKAIGEGAGKAASAIGEGAGKAAGAIGEGAGKAASAVGEGAGKAMDAVKGLFK